MGELFNLCANSQWNILSPEIRRAGPLAGFRRHIRRLKFAPVLQHSWQWERSSDKVYSPHYEIFSVGNNSPSRGV
jgi:hypothetical protein